MGSNKPDTYKLVKILKNGRVGINIKVYAYIAICFMLPKDIDKTIKTVS